ncbi:uncharacterized protein LOC134578541 [Pelobates fuscus]|uniref:uncharacterized protein LOC134578541 n=1 Tax=Pelobates fuscus TaxID=191477 RepID=UPI002FE44B36
MTPVPPTPPSPIPSVPSPVFSDPLSVLASALSACLLRSAQPATTSASSMALVPYSLATDPSYPLMVVGSDEPATSDQPYAVGVSPAASGFHPTTSQMVNPRNIVTGLPAPGPSAMRAPASLDVASYHGLPNPFPPEDDNVQGHSLFRPQDNRPSQRHATSGLHLQVPPATDGAPPMYVTFNPSQAATLVTSLPDPEKQPMPFFRRINITN